MSKEDRDYFERALLKELKGLQCNDLALSVLKGTLKFRWDKKVVAELDFQYLVKSRAYVLLGRVFGGPIYECASNIEPPYRSNLASAACFSFTTSGRQDKKFSPEIYGSIRLPSPDTAEAVCKHIRNVLENRYVPMIVGCVLGNERTLDDVIASPTDYAYPAVFIHCAIACNPHLLKPGMLQALKSNKKIIKNKTFDLGLLERFQEASQANAS